MDITSNKMKVFHQSAFDRWPFEDKSMQAIITSPPFYSLREYDIPDVIIGGWQGQYGLESSYKLYIEHTLLWCQEAWRVLRDDGVMLLNLGDSYSGSGKGLYGDGTSHGTEGKKQKTNYWSVGVPCVPSYDKNGKVPQDCPLNDSIWNRPCDGCQAVSVLRTFHKDRPEISLSSSDLHVPTLGHKGLRNDHVPTSGSLIQTQTHLSSSSIQDQQHSQSHEGEQIPASQESMPSEFSLQSQAECLQKDNVFSSPSSDLTLPDTIQESEHKKVCSLASESSEATQGQNGNISCTSSIADASAARIEGMVYVGCPYLYSNIINHQSQLPSKCLLDIPFRVSIALVDQQGWIKRNNIPWYSPNKMPESVTDRFSKKHEMIFMMVKKPKYYFDLKSVKEPYTEPMNRWGGEKLVDKGQSTWYEGTGQQSYRDRDMRPDKDGKNPGDVWVINTQPSPEKHFAMWPESLVERMILCSTKPGDTVLDPFCGSGTTLRVADKHNRIAYGIDMGYSDIQDRRLSNIQKNLLFERRN